MQRDNLLAVFDPAQKNMGCVVYDPKKDELVTVCMINLKGERTTAPSSAEYVKRLNYLLERVPVLSEGITRTKIEYQAGLSKYNDTIQKALKDYYEARNVEVEIVNPRTLFKRMRPHMETVPKCKPLLAKYDKEIATKSKSSYRTKKKADVAFGKKLLCPGVEFRLFEGVKPGLKKLQDALRNYDKKNEKRMKNKRKRPRTVKTQEDDSLECVIIAVDDAGTIEKRLKRRK